MKKTTLYITISIIGIVIPFVTVWICNCFKYDNSIIVAIVTAVSTVITGIINLLCEKSKTQTKNQTTTKINSGINISGKSKVKGNIHFNNK